MHILIPVLHRPIKPTGVCRHAVNLAQCLAHTETVSKVTLVIGEWQNEYFEQSFHLESPKIQVVSIATQRRAAVRNIWYLKGLPKVANQLAADIVHMSFPFPFIRQLFNAPVVCSTIHDLYPFECPENFGYPQVWFNQWFLKQSVSSSDGLACVSQVTLNSLNEFFPRQASQNREVIYNYVDFEKIEPVIPKATALQPGSPFFLSVAQHRKNKNLDLLIQAYSSLMKKAIISAKTQLILVGGTGPETGALEQLVGELGLEKQVHFLSGLSDSHLCWLYQHCELFVIPSSTEGFCLPLVEALSWESKVVCSDIPIFREVGNSSCTYFETTSQANDQLTRDSSVAKLTEAIEQAITTHPPTENQLQTQRDPRFSKDYVAQQLLDFYTSVKKSHASN